MILIYLEYFLRTFRGMYDHVFPLKDVIIKFKTVLNLWMVKALQKSSKRKQKHYRKFVKARKYKALFEVFNKKSKKMSYPKRMENPQQNIKKKTKKKHGQQ